MKRLIPFAALLLLSCASPQLPPPPATSTAYDIVLRGGTIYDGSGGQPFKGDVAILRGRIVNVGKFPGRGTKEIDVAGKAVAPGFINMLSWANESLMADGRGLSDLKQGVTLEVMGEGSSMGPWNAEMIAQETARQGDVKYPITWTTLGGYLETLEKKGVGPNVASMIGAETARTYVLGEGDVDPTAAQLVAMRGLVVQAMEEGALGVGTSLIYAPGGYAETDELVGLATEAGRCGGIYVSHMRYESDRLLDGVDELIEISRRSGAPGEIWHLKAAGKDNWGKLDDAIARIEAARASGLRISANMYTYTAGSTGFDAAMPPWVQAGGREAWIARLKDPATRARVIAEIRDPKGGYENLYRHAGAEGTIMVGFRTEALKSLTGRTLADYAKEKGVSPEDAMIDLVIADGSRVQVVYFLMSEANVKRQVGLPWMSFGSDAAALAPEGVFLKSSTHPRAYGNFARVLGKYVRDEKAASLPDAIRRLSAMPAENLGLRDRGRIAKTYHADVVVFDPATVRDNATYLDPNALSSGIRQVFVNGEWALRDGEPTGLAPGRFVPRSDPAASAPCASRCSRLTT